MQEILLLLQCCTVTISSFDDKECQLNSKQLRSYSVSAIIGGIASALLLILVLASIMIVTVILLLLWFRKKRQVSLKHTRYSNGTYIESIILLSQQS